MRLRRVAALALVGAALAGAAGARAQPEGSRAADRIARRSLEDARALVREGRLEHAEIALRRGLDAKPDHARLHRTLAEVLAAQGRSDEAARERSLADALDPPADPLPQEALSLPTGGLLVVMLPPEPDAAHPERIEGGWPARRELRALEDHVRMRLRGARIVHANPESVGGARDWLAERASARVLSLRVERAWCGESIKDGRLALATLRGAAAATGMPRAGVAIGRQVIFDPGPACEADALARAFERLLVAPEIEPALRAEVQRAAALPRAALRALFPGIEVRIDAELRAGERLLGQGRIGDAEDRFRLAVEIDPEDPIARAYLHEARATIALASELARRAGEPGNGIRLDPRLTPAQLAAAEARLRDEEGRRRDLLAALAVLGEQARPPDAKVLAALQPAEITDSRAFGPALARRRAGGAIEARVAHAPDGSVLARYYFPSASDEPVVREDDTNGDRAPDRWIVYEGRARSEVIEVAGDGRPALHLVFGGSGVHVERVEVDANRDERPERILHYRDGRLSAEARDSDGDGRLDVFERLDAEGRVALREEDVDADGEIDVRTRYDAGRLVRRELTRPELAP